MKKVKLSLSLAQKMYQGSDEQLKAFALENYPNLAKSITDRVKNFQDVIDISMANTNYYMKHSNETEGDLATRKIKLLVEVLNEGWTPNWDNSSESKYYPWFDMSSSGSGFSYHVFDYANSASSVGSRLVFKSSELAKYAGTQFQDLYKQMFTL